MSLHDDLLAAIKDRPFCTTSQLADAVGEPDTRLVSRELGNLRKVKPITKNGQGLWCAADLVGEPYGAVILQDKPAQPSEKARAAVTKLDRPIHEVKQRVELKPVVLPPPIRGDLKLALEEVERLLNPKLLPAVNNIVDIDVELAVLARFIELFHPSITVVLERTFNRLVELKAYNEAKAA